MGLSSTHPPRTFDPYLLTHKALTLSCSHSIVIIIYTIQTDFITRRHTLSNTRWLAHEYMILTMQDNLTDRGILVRRGWTSKPTNQREKHMLITSSKTSSKWSNKFDSLLTHNWPQPRTPIATHAHTRILFQKRKARTGGGLSACADLTLIMEGILDAVMLRACQSSEYSGKNTHAHHDYIAI
jgi:hypothetical protein